MIIKQAVVSPWLTHFKDAFFRRYGFINYTDRAKPVMVFGCYLKKGDHLVALGNRALAVIAWAGHDTWDLYKRRNVPQVADVIKEFRTRTNIVHVVSSANNSHDLTLLGIKHVFAVVCPVVPGDFRVCPLGDSVYVYSSHNKPKKYGEPTARKVEARLLTMGHSIPFIYCYTTPPNHITPENMQTVYSRCFVGLRLTWHDGLSNTAIEMGLMGRRMIYNQDMPSAIPYANEDEIIQKILQERERVGSVQHEVATKTNDFINDNEWLDTEFYGSSFRGAR